MEAGTQSTSTPLTAVRRAAVAKSADLATITHSDHSIISIIEATTASVDLSHWIAANRRRVEELLATRGALVFRGFHITEPAEFHEVVRSWSPKLLDYTYGSTPRSQSDVAGVYSSTEYPADQTIPQHNEMAYARIWPSYLWFCAAQPATEGGATPLADCRRVTARLSKALVQTFAERELKYVRNYGTGFDLSWQQTFETDSRAEVEKVCEAQSIEYSWNGEHLHTTQRCQAIIEHPVTGEELWFNQAQLFHTSSLPKEVRTQLATASEFEIPRQVYYGDGQPIPDAVLDQVREAFVAESVREPWQRGDVMLVDNMLVSHGRDPYRGPRKIMVAMTDEFSKAGA
ncbi:TauD/TfdA family dioxygenase [Catenulispora sp. NF23]|uniref:TauD/TfdA family dioxygenase n=1 Tax=Catenulispora pinistramenti TaxID=2705254 RepID=UPI001BA9C992|nr:TauD/TfdA family dioxygenase [Catenulispora pinistramenti]MBS2531668.1 TauD/TfdA family dioxygenase [Catenulispora pinistramenti]